MKVYTYNDKVLVNSANDKWLKEKEGPAGFVMNASNAIDSSTSAGWESPGYPDAWDGNGKTLELTVSQDITVGNSFALYYTEDGSSTGGPRAVAFRNGGSPIISAGKYTYTLDNNPATAGGYGKYLVLSDGESTSNWLPYISMRILD